MLEYCEDFDLKYILNEVKSAKFYSFIADNTTHIFQFAFVM